MNRHFLSIMLLSLVFNVGLAQTEQPESSAQSLTERFKSFRANADNYGEYKVIKATDLNSFWSVVEDSLKVKNSAIASGNENIVSLNSTIEGLQQELGTSQANLEESKAESSSIVILGSQVNKQSFAIFFWVITSVLILALGAMTFLFMRSNAITKQTLADKKELDDKVNDLRHKYTEREIVLKRELQTERNRVEELKNKVMS